MCPLGYVSLGYVSIRLCVIRLCFIRLCVVRLCVIRLCVTPSGEAVENPNQDEGQGQEDNPPAPKRQRLQEPEAQPTEHQRTEDKDMSDASPKDKEGCEDKTVTEDGEDRQPTETRAASRDNNIAGVEQENEVVANSASVVDFVVNVEDSSPKSKPKDVGHTYNIREHEDTGQEQ